MAWERKCRYYYRSERRGDRVVKVYIGTGVRAVVAAEADAAMRVARAADRANALRLAQDLEAINRETAELDDTIELVTTSVLVTAGYGYGKAV